MIRKVCGITDRTDIKDLLQLDIDWVGFIFVRSSKRSNLNRPVIETPLHGPKRIGVFKDSTLEEILSIASTWHLDGVQLHGNESAHLCAVLRERGFLVMKVFGIQQEFKLTRTKAFVDSVDYFLFDTPGGGTGKSFDWGALNDYKGPVPFLIAGGIGEESINALQALTHPYWTGIDLNSKFEHEPGNKDTVLLQKFLAHEL